MEAENRRVVICTIIVLANAMIYSLLRTYKQINGLHFIFSLVYIGVLLQWLFSIRRRFIQSDIRNNLTAAAVLMIFWISERYVKYALVNEYSVINRYMWYMYYIPFIMVPVLMFMSALYIGKTDEDKIDKRWNVCYVPAVIVAVGILTNDLHQLAFRFRPGMVNWGVDYSRGILYTCALAILILSITGMVIQVIRNAANKKNYKVLWLTGIIVAIGIMYLTGYTSTDNYQQKHFLQMMFEFPDFTCFFLVAFFESLVYNHLLPSNSGHESFFALSSLHAGLADNDYNVRIKGREWDAPTPSMIKMAESWPLYIAENSNLLKCIPVSGGHLYWMEDVEELIRLNEKLAETGDYLEEERLMLDESVKLEESKRSTEEQNRLYDMVAKGLQPQLNDISRLLGELSEDEEKFRSQMKYIGILGSYIKRRSNLLLLAGMDKVIESSELKVSIEELFSYVSFNGVSCMADIEQGLILPSEYALFVFELLGNVIEAAMPGLSALMTALREEDGELVYYIEAAAPTETLSEGWYEERYRTAGDNVSYGQESKHERSELLLSPDRIARKRGGHNNDNVLSAHHEFSYDNGCLEISIEDDCEFITFSYRIGGEEA